MNTASAASRRMLTRSGANMALRASVRPMPAMLPPMTLPSASSD